MYSLVNIATVVRDLARGPRAGAAADQLVRAFALDATALALLDELSTDATAQAERRQRVLADARSRPQALQVLRETRDRSEVEGLAAYAGAVDVLESATLGSLDDLRAFVRRDVLAGAWLGEPGLEVALHPRALEVVADGVVGVVAGDAELARPWLDAVADLDLQPAPAPWPELVATVAALPPDAAVPPAPADWALHMHDACWAVHLTGRERDAAITQLHALRALVTTVGAPPPMRTVAMVVAAVHAGVVADILDEPTYDAMTQPLFRLVP